MSVFSVLGLFVHHDGPLVYQSRVDIRRYQNR
jgi:hypothetical protein